MELQVMDATQEYRLLMLQPDPESGERVCVGIVLEDDVVFDAKLSKLKCFSHAFDLSVTRFYLNEIRDSLRRSRGMSVQQVISGYAPIFSCSAARRVASPVTETVKATLLRRFVMQENSELPPSQPELNPARKSFSTKLRRITTEYLQGSFDHVIENAKPSDITGRAHPEIGRVALALKRLDRVVLMDGVDLSSATSKKIINQSARVVHTFWQYKRLNTQNIMRVAVVFNGLPRERAIDRDTHDFVFDQFQLEADKTIDGSSLDITKQVSELLLA
jgi:hypothetical protein